MLSTEENHLLTRAGTENALRVRWSVHPIPGDEPFEQERNPYWYSPLIERQIGSWHTTYGMNQDSVAMVSQGRIADRTKELLGQSDRGSLLMGKRFVGDLDSLESGGDPKVVVRDRAQNVRVPLPGMSAQRVAPRWCSSRAASTTAG